MTGRNIKIQNTHNNALLLFQQTNIRLSNSTLNNNLLRSSTSAKFVTSSRKKTDVNPKTLELQNKLGNLPVPNINDTIAKFLISAKPLLNDQEFSTTAKKLLQLAQPNGIGEKLQGHLLKRKEENDSWVRGRN